MLLLHLLSGFLYFTVAHAQQKEPAWDNTKDKDWSKDFSTISIRSSADGSLQKAWFHATAGGIPKPLIISLHTWSGDYNQEDPLAKEVLLRDWNYIHPDFRGANNKPDGCGSALVIADIEDAIEYGIKHCNADPDNVHIIGVSGGGYATLLAYMKIKYPVRSFNAWASISDLTDWYWESKGRKAKYAGDIEKVAAENGNINRKLLDSRSPLQLPLPRVLRKDAKLNIYAGVHDGYTGSVPISHSVLFYNKIAASLYPAQQEKLVADTTLLSLIAKQINPYADTTNKIGGRVIHLQKHSLELSLTIFEGGHEMLVNCALALTTADSNVNNGRLHVLTIGDSNGAFDFGWPQQLAKLLPYSTVINKSVSGNTIGFNNLNRPELNTLTNINQYLADAYDQLPADETLDYIFIALGTNDTKTVFKDRQKEVPENMKLLLQKINMFLQEHHKKLPHICIITPSPMDEQMIDQVKYGGGNARIQHNNKLFKKIAAAEHADFINSYDQLKEDFAEKTIDGIHLKDKTQLTLAGILVNYINKKSTQ